MHESIVKPEKSSKSRPQLVLTENALVVLANRYLKKDAQGKVIETPGELFGRVARQVAGAEKTYGADEQAVRLWEDRFYNLMASLRFLPNSPTLMNAGRTMGMLSACFVLPIPDSIDGIFDAVKYTAQIQKAGGGTGFSFDQLRPTGDYISSSGGKTSGPISFWKVLSETTNAIQQGAFRRGANMAMLSVSHPDILKFLHAKCDLNAFNNYNISVKVTDEWMRRLMAEPGALHVVVNPRTREKYYLPRDLEVWEYEIDDLVKITEEAENPDAIEHRNTDTQRPNPTGGQKESDFWTLGQIWQVIVAHAHRTGEPGVAFIDRINRDNMTPQLGPIEATNPCGEQPLLPYEACNLGSINLDKFVSNHPTEEGGIIARATEVEPLGRIDFSFLRETVNEAVRFLDNVIDINQYQIDRIEEMCKGNRKIGLGVMGFADLLYKLALPYNSEPAMAVGRELMRFINEQAHQASEDLAVQRGTFPNFEGSRWDTEYHRPQRNAAVTTVAPTGTLSIIADCSGGVEPMYSLAFTRNILGDKQLTQVNATFKRIAQEQGFYSEDLIGRIAQKGTLADLEEIPEDIKRVFVCAYDISPRDHVRMQAAFQEHCDAAISKTINFPKDATVEQVDAIYRLAFELGCKGITVYRDTSRDRQPMALSEGKIKPRENVETPGMEKGWSGPPKNILKPIFLPEIMSCLRVRQMTPFGNMHVKITVDPDSERELEVFAQLGKGGDVANSDLEAICRLLSLFLRCGGSMELAIQQLEGIGSSLSIPSREGRIMSLGDGLAQAMMKYLHAKEKNGLKSLLLGKVGLATPENCVKIDKVVVDLGGFAVGNNRLLGNSRHEPSAGYKLKCPVCSDVLIFEEGCVKCNNCGFSQC